MTKARPQDNSQPAAVAELAPTNITPGVHFTQDIANPDRGLLRINRMLTLDQAIEVLTILRDADDEG